MRELVAAPAGTVWKEPAGQRLPDFAVSCAARVVVQLNHCCFPSPKRQKPPVQHRRPPEFVDRCFRHLLFVAQVRDQRCLGSMTLAYPAVEAAVMATHCHHQMAQQALVGLLPWALSVQAG